MLINALESGIWIWLSAVETSLVKYGMTPASSAAVRASSTDDMTFAKAAAVKASRSASDESRIAPALNDAVHAGEWRVMEWIA
jgi:hypothetical protein